MRLTLMLPALFMAALAPAKLYAQTSDTSGVATRLGAAALDTSRAILGEKVRFLVPSVMKGMQYGTFRGLEADQLIVDPRNRSDLKNWAIPLIQLEFLEARRGDGGNRKHYGALIGMVVGGVVFGGGGYLASRNSGEYERLAGSLMAPTGVGLGALVGGLVGRTKKGHHWFPVRIPAGADSGQRR